MNLRHSKKAIVGASFLLVIAVARLFGQGVDPELRVQSSLDSHKAQDPTNSDRALTGKTREFQVSSIPIPAGPSPEAIKRIQERIQELEKKKKQEPSGRVKALDASGATSKAEEEDAKTLQRLKAEVAEAYKARKKAELQISDVPLPRAPSK